MIYHSEQPALSLCAHPSSPALKLILSYDFEFILEDKYSEIREKTAEVTLLIDGLRKSQLAK